MNKVKVTHKNINGGKETVFSTPFTEKETKDQLYEIFEKEHYKAGKVKRDMVVVDVGANIGLTSYYFKDWAKVIYALEPSKDCYEALCENVKSYSHIKPFNIGLAHKDMMELLRSNDKGEIPQSLFGNGQKIELATFLPISTFVEDHNIDHIDLLKIDTEGAEYIIFPSASFEKVAPKIDYIVGEAHYVNSHLVPDFIPVILKNYGFKTHFLPIRNYILNMYYDRENGSRKNYKLIKKTLFFATR